MNFADLLESMGSLKEGLADLQGKLRGLEFTGEGGAGLVRVTVNGVGDCVRVEIDPSLTSDLPMLQDLVVAAQNQARARMEQKVQEEVKSTMGSLLPIPPWLLSRL